MVAARRAQQERTKRGKVGGGHTKKKVVGPSQEDSVRPSNLHFSANTLRARKVAKVQDAAKVCTAVCVRVCVQRCVYGGVYGDHARWPRYLNISTCSIQCGGATHISTH